MNLNHLSNQYVFHSNNLFSLESVVNDLQNGLEFIEINRRLFPYLCKLPKGYEDVKKEVQELNLTGTQVVFNVIKKEDNSGAIMLALGCIVENTPDERNKAEESWCDDDEIDEDQYEGESNEEEDDDDGRGYKEPPESGSEKLANRKRRIVEWAAKTQITQKNEQED